MRNMFDVLECEKSKSFRRPALQCNEVTIQASSSDLFSLITNIRVKMNKRTKSSASVKNVVINKNQLESADRNKREKLLRFTKKTS
jgi:hypothetical protein